MHNDSEVLIQLPPVNDLHQLRSLYHNSVHLDENIVEVISNHNIRWQDEATLCIGGNIDQMTFDIL